MILVLLLAVPLIKLGRTLDEATIAIRKAHEGSAPLLDDAQVTLTTVNTQLERVDGVTASAQAVAANTRALSSLFTATLGGPLVKVAALSYGVRKASQARKLKNAPPSKRSRQRQAEFSGMKRLFWVGVGVAVGVSATRKVTQAAHRASPAGVGASLGEGLRELGAGLGAFGAEVRAGMAEREDELYSLVEDTTGSRCARRAPGPARTGPVPARHARVTRRGTAGR